MFRSAINLSFIEWFPALHFNYASESASVRNNLNSKLESYLAYNFNFHFSQLQYDENVVFDVSLQMDGSRNRDLDVIMPSHRKNKHR